MSTLCGSLDNFVINVQNITLYNGIIAPGFECLISEAKYNNTPRRSLSLSFIQTFFLPLPRLMFCFDSSLDFQCMLFASLKIIV